jgi:tRNA pseudouridine32 synthase/23S rRNA pseudouridine746 synthase/23S rRNA pseudouridine1911/1915/1917 synthase
LINKPKIPKKYQPLGYEVLHEDQDLIVGSKASGILSVAALWEKQNTVHHHLNTYVRKGSSLSKKCVYVVHRLDQATTGVLMFAKSEKAQFFLKENWNSTVKYYYAIVYGHLAKKSGTISSYLTEDEEYTVHSTSDSSMGKLAKTEYSVVKETPHYSVVKINLITGKKNQIRVHMAELGNPIVGDPKYGKSQSNKNKMLMLHAFSIEFTHPFSKKRLRVQSNVPEHFTRLVDYNY